MFFTEVQTSFYARLVLVLAGHTLLWGANPRASVYCRPQAAVRGVTIVRPITNCSAWVVRPLCVVRGQVFWRSVCVVRNHVYWRSPRCVVRNQVYQRSVACTIARVVRPLCRMHHCTGCAPFVSRSGLSIWTYIDVREFRASEKSPGRYKLVARYKVSACQVLSEKNLSRVCKKVFQRF